MTTVSTLYVFSRLRIHLSWACLYLLSVGSFISNTLCSRCCFFSSSSSSRIWSLASPFLNQVKKKYSACYRKRYYGLRRDARSFILIFLCSFFCSEIDIEVGKSVSESLIVLCFIGSAFDSFYYARWQNWKKRKKSGVFRDFQQFFGEFDTGKRWRNNGVRVTTKLSNLSQNPVLRWKINKKLPPNSKTKN